MINFVISVFSAFAGYDSQFLALRRFAKWFNWFFKDQYHLEFDLRGWCEIDPYAIKSHNALFPEYKNRHYSNITMVPWHKVEHMLLVYSSCCQDISGNGKRAGLAKDSGTRSALIWEVLDGIKSQQPKIAILENVSDLLNKSFCNQFRQWQVAVDDEGYTSSWDTLCASDFGVPQNRDRAFVVSFRNDIRRKIDFPKPFADNKLKDVESLLEDKVDETYYHTDEDAVRYIIALHGKKPGVIKDISFKNRGECVKRYVTPACMKGSHRICHTLLASVANYTKSYKYLTSTGNYPGIAVIEVWKTLDGINIPYYDYIASAEVDEGNGNSIDTNATARLVMDELGRLEPDCYFRLRRLTPRECFRLMGVDKKSIHKLVTSGVPDNELYKQAGNAIVVDVLFNIYKKIFTIDTLTKLSNQ